MTRSADISGSIATADGIPLALREWSTPAAGRGLVLLVHGLGEHSGRYDHVAAQLCAKGWDVVGYDHRGHGHSGGRRGAIRTDHDLLDDLALVYDHVRSGRSSARSPFVLFGHSMGGLLAAQFVARALRPVDALVLSAPALDAGLTWVQRVQLAVGRALVPDVAVSNKLDPAFVSHDPAVVRAYREDPLVHDRVTPRLARALVDGGSEVLRSARAWRVPTLLMWAEDDRLVSPAGSAAFAAAAPAGVIRSRCFGGLYHEILNELDPAPVFALLDAWLDERRRFPISG